MTSPALALAPIRPHGLCFDPDDACRHLATVDPRLGVLMSRAGAYRMRPEPTQSLFTALLRSIVYQQLSGQLQLARIKKNQDTPVFTGIQCDTAKMLEQLG